MPVQSGEMAWIPEGKRRSVVRKDLKYLAGYYFKGTDGQPYRLQDYHVEILESMFEGGKLVVNVPTDHMKSSLGCFLFPLFSLMDDPDQSHIVCGANINDSIRRVQAMRLELETNQLLIEDFPWLARPTERDNRIWTATHFNVAGRTINKPNPSVLASAIGSNDLKGRRGKLLMDDVEGEDARWSPTKREQLESWLKFEAWRCYEDRRESERPLLCLLGTPFDVDSIYFRMERQGWKVIRHSCYTDGGWEPTQKPVSPGLDTWGQPLHAPKLVRQYLWPEKEEKVEKARKDLRKLEFSVAYLMDPTGGDPSRLSELAVKGCIEDAEALGDEQFSGFVSLDPATGGRAQNRRLDYAGIAVTRINWPQGELLPRLEVLECHAYPQGLFEQVNFAADLSERCGYPVLIERNGQQGETYQQTFRHLRPSIKTLLYYTTGHNKFDATMGLTVVKRLVMDRRLWVPEVIRDSDGFQAFVAEIRDLAPPFNQHNHISMAIWIAFRYVYERVRHSKVPAIGLSYGMNPMTQMRDILHYEDDPNLTPLERAYRAIGYDRTARQGTPMVMGYTAWRWYREMPWERAIREEEERFMSAVRGPRVA